MSKKTEPQETVFDIGDVLVPQNFDQQVEVKKEPPPVNVRKPGRDTFFQTLPDSANWLTVATVKELYETYLVAAKLKESIHGCRTTTLVPWIDRYGNVSVYPLNLPLEGYSPTGWFTTASDAVIQAQSGWLQMASNRSAQAYDLVAPKGNLPEPAWPEPLDIKDLVQRAFADKYIGSLDHQVIRRREGQE